MFADKRAAVAAGCMTVAALGMLGAGVAALLTGIPLGVAGLFLMMSAPCGLVATSLTTVAIRGREASPSPDPVSVTSAPAAPAPAAPAPAAPAPAAPAPASVVPEELDESDDEDRVGATSPDTAG